MKRMLGLVIVVVMGSWMGFYTEALGQQKPEAKKLFDCPALGRADFNRLALIRHIPLFWVEDQQHPGVVDPAEVAVIGTGARIVQYVKGGKFTTKFKDAYLALVEERRQEALRHELNQGRVTLVQTDFSKASEEDRAVVTHVLRAARIIEDLFAVQRGALKYRKQILAKDKTALAVFERNQGPWCTSPKTEQDPHCNAVVTFPGRHSDAYPKGLKQNVKMCDMLRKQKNGKVLLDPFTVVRKKGDGFVALPLHKVYGPRMKQVAKDLRTAAAAIKDENEAAFKKYLLAAAKGFETNDWSAADEAWVAMNGYNSKWYLRIAPDEVYFDPCQEKAGFHVSFARIDQKSLIWQKKLQPLRDEMEAQLAKLIGPPYKARKVQFNFPDFIEIVLNAGDARMPAGAVIGQSLPNWGKVAEEGRRRTVVMTNLYMDRDSIRIARAQARSLFVEETMKYFTGSKDSTLLTIIIHEATHNFGPHTDHKVNGKGPTEIFGGRLATTLEELKAETGAIWYIDLLVKRGAITPQSAKEAYTAAIKWCFGHISRGMFTATGKPKPYSQLAAIQVGFFMKEGALSWETSRDPKTGQSIGKFQIRFDKLHPAIEKLMQQTGQFLAKGDRAGARKFIDYFVKGEGAKLVHMEQITERILRYPKASFFYSIVL